MTRRAEASPSDRYPFALLIGGATHFAVQFRQFHNLRRHRGREVRALPRP